MSDASQGQSTVSGFAARRALFALRKHKVEASPLLRRAGLLGYNPGDHERRISANNQAQLVEYAAEALKDTAFGLHLAQETDPREVGLLFYAVSAGKDVRAALALFARVRASSTTP